MKDSLKLLCLFLLLLCVGCASPKKTIAPEDYYAPPAYTITLDKEAPIEIDAEGFALNKTLFKRELSDRNILVAYASHIDEPLLALITLDNSPSNEAQQKRNTLQLEIHSRITAIFSQTNAITAELGCKEERIDQIATTISDLNDKSISELTVASIPIGAAISVAGAYMTNDSQDKGVATGGGVIDAGLSFLALNPKGKEVMLKHPRNLLHCFMTEKNNGEFPPFVWYMINEHRFTNSEEGSILQHMQQRRVRNPFDSGKEEALKAMLFSDGGVYYAGDLHTYAEMFDQMQSVIHSLHQNIGFFIQEVNILMLKE